MKRLLRGAVAGAVATAPMSAVMVGAKKFGLMGGMPPEKITAKILKRSGNRPSSQQQDALATVFHFAFGTAAGAAFGVVAPKRLVARVPLGVAYGASIWGVSYMGWVPAFGIMPPSHRDRRDRQVVMFAGHLVYGAVLSILVGRGADQNASEADPQG